MRSHVIVAVLAFAAGALVVWLVVFAGKARVPETAPIEPSKSAVANESLAAETTNSAAPTKSVDVATSASIPAGTMRQAKAERRTTCLLGGYVRSSEESSRPVAHAYVGLFHAALEDDGPTTEFGLWGGNPALFPKRRQLLTYAYSDDDGRFSFDELQAGTYVVHVEYGPLVTASTAPQTLAPGEMRGGLDVPLPLTGSLAGQILAPPDTTFEGWRVALEPSTKEQMHATIVDGRTDNRLYENVEDDGSFEIGPSEAGLHRVLLLWPGHARYGQDLALPIGEVMIVVGQSVQQTFDLRQGFPGSLNVTLRIPALEGEDAPLYADKVSYSIFATPRFTNAKLKSVEGSGLMGQTAVIGPLEPGVWSLSVLSPIGFWTYKAPGEELVEAGQARDVTLEVPLFAGTLTCIDAATGGPLVESTVMIWSNGSGVATTTDAKGRLEMQYPVGTYTIATFSEADGKFDDALPETIDWREDGAHPSTVKLLRPSTSAH